MPSKQAAASKDGAGVTVVVQRCDKVRYFLKIKSSAAFRVPSVGNGSGCVQS